MLAKDHSRRESIGALLVRVARQTGEPRTVSDLARESGRSIRTFQDRCKAAGTNVKSCLDFMRCLKIVLATHGDWHPRETLSDYYADPRTVDRLARLGGLDGPHRPTVPEFLSRQRILRSVRVCEQVRRALSGR